MIQTPTVFIVGAGASRELGMPLGYQLTEMIETALDFRSNRGVDASRELVRGALSLIAKLRRDEIEGLFAHANSVSEGLGSAPSIDAYIHNHSADAKTALVGKVGIAACLVTAEGNSDLAAGRGQPPDLSRVKDSWLPRLFNIMAADASAAAPEKMFEHVSFIVFNYDRCLEHYLRHAIARRFRRSVDEATDIVRRHCRIVHPYGALGDLWGPDALPFGPKLESTAFGDCDAIRRASERILTFSQSQEANSKAAQALIAQAKRAIFLGLAFHRQTLELLTVKSSKITDYRATAYKTSQSNQSEIMGHLVKVLAMNAFLSSGDPLVEGTAAQLIDDEEHFLRR